MVKECLNELVNTKTDVGDIRKNIVKRYIESYDEEELINLLMTPYGIIAYDINIHYFPNVGFRCSNDISKTGRLPICNVIQNILNKYYNSLL